ncbi:hypothetical protein ACLQ29_16510 [Micromonospora sp. DT228]|uniref:hypothetical protein n=1 Tax=Micromonospora sp. DT228 TaxID=3393443 RepID=UPI003CFB1BF2
MTPRTAAESAAGRGARSGAPAQGIAQGALLVQLDAAVTGFVDRIAGTHAGRRVAMVRSD